MLNLTKDALTPEQVEEHIGFTKATLATWRSRKTGPRYIKLMGRIYYLRTDLQEWLDQQIEVA